MDLDFSRPSILEMFGLSPLRERTRQAVVALRGAEHVPPSRFDHSSLKLLKPSLSFALWAGKCPLPRTVVLTNLFNHRQTATEEGWSVRRRQTEDFRGKTLTYDSHNGTDFALPIGTRVTAAAPGLVVRVYAEFNRGGLKVVIDHGGGLVTTSGHLARAFVREGDVVRRGQTIALSGYSGLDGFSTFPWGIPHVHFNAWLDGVPVDPFARTGTNEASLWRNGAPEPAREANDLEDFVPSMFRPEVVLDVLSACRTEKIKNFLRNLKDDETRGSYLVTEMNYYPTRFPVVRNLYTQTHDRTERLTMPVRPEDFDGFVFDDER